MPRESLEVEEEMMETTDAIELQRYRVVLAGADGEFDRDDVEIIHD